MAARRGAWQRPSHPLRVGLWTGTARREALPWVNRRVPRGLFRILLPIGLFVLAALAPAWAQEYAFQYFGTEQGLTNLAVKTLFQDRVGFIWVGTEHGVFRYEGIRFREFSPAQNLPASYSASIGEAPDGSVLVGNQSGLFRLRGDRFENVPLPAGTRVNGYIGIVADGNRTWVATDAGIVEVTMKPGGELNLRMGPRPADDRDIAARSIFVSDHVMWWGCGYSLCRFENGSVTDVGAPAGLRAAASAVNAILRDRQGNLWVSQNRRLLVLRPGSSTFEDADPSLSPVGAGSGPVLDSDGRVLVATNDGLAILEGSVFRVTGRSSGLLAPVYSVLQDREGSVWLGLAGRGLAKWAGYGEWENFGSQSGLTGETVHEILPDSNGVVWAGTETGFFRGEARQGRWSWRAEKAFGRLPVHAVQRAPDGKLWLGTDSRGLARFDPRTGAVKWFGAAEGLVGHSPNAILIDRDQTVWAGTENGIFLSEPGRDRFHRLEETSHTRCWALAQSPNGDIWAGMADGLWVRSGSDRGSPSKASSNTWRSISTKDGLRNSAVVSVATETSGVVWIGYRLNGTVTRVSLDEGRVSLRHFDPPPGPASNITYFLGFDARHRLWAGTNVGVQVLSADQTRWDRYDRRDGLVWDDCDLHAFAAEPDGHVWIGTSGGLSRFLPRTPRVQRDPPRTIFTSVALGKTEFDPTRGLTFDYSSDPLVARFTALRFGHDRDVTFRYILKPLYTVWKETADRELQFPALPPGSYRLEVEARDSMSRWSDVPAALQIVVRAPWWRTWWFLGASALAVAFAFGLILRRRSARQDAIRRALENAVAERTRELSHQYRHDVLTGLPNRLLFGERLNRELELARRNGTRVAVLFIDLDRFKRINDTWGHQTGDLFLRRISERLASGLRPTETIGRIGGDEFIVLIPGLLDKREAEVRGWDLLRTLDAPILVEGNSVFATMSVGIATFPEDAGDSRLLMAAADAAMYRAKAAGKNQVLLFEPGMTEAASRPQNIEDRLREALRTGGFRLRYQPQYTIGGELVGFEALLRIAGSETELTPGEFIPIAEESGLIVEIGAWVLREACRQTRVWHMAGFPGIRIAVNVSVVQLSCAGFEESLLKVLDATGLDPHRLELEITETALVKNMSASAGLLDRIRGRGVRIALDDFGTGFSPMQYLQQLPVDVVKIDQVFVRDLDARPSSVPLVEGMVKLAKTLSLSVVAEGVETRAQFEILRQIGFDLAQGNLLSLPVTAEQAETLIRAGALVRA